MSDDLKPEKRRRSWLQDEVQFPESCGVLGLHCHGDARDLQARILGLELAHLCEHPHAPPGPCRAEQPRWRTFP